MSEGEIVNRVIGSGLITIDLEDFYHAGERVVFDIKHQLFQELVLREKDFREFVKNNDWGKYKDKNVAIICSVDAIVPTWAYLLLASELQPFANKVVFGNFDMLEQALFQEAISKIDFSALENQRVVVKGCGKYPVPLFAYVELTERLRPIVRSIMYGEPCSTVPIYKKPRG